MQPEVPTELEPDSQLAYDSAVLALEEKYWSIVRRFERLGYCANIVEASDTTAATRVLDDGVYPGPSVYTWAAHVWDFHGSAEALVTIDTDGNAVVRQIVPNPQPESDNIETEAAEPNETIAEIVRRLATEAINPPPIPDHTSAAKINPFDAHQGSGLLEAIARWVTRTNRLPSPEFSMLAAIAFVSALYGRRVLGPTNAGLNIYVAGIATTGFGKEHPLKALQLLAHDCSLSRLIGPGDVTSGASIEKILRRRPAFVMPMDELGALLQSVNGRGAATWARTIRKVLLELFSKSDSVWTGKEYADPTRDSSADPIFCPTVSLMGMSTPETFFGALTEESLSDGFLSRLLVVSATHRPKAREIGKLDAPTSLIDMVKDYEKALPQSELAAAGSRDAALRPAMVRVSWENDAARDYWLAIEEWQNSQIADHGRMNGVLGRFALQTIKLATIRALSRNPGRPQVCVDDVEWGRAVVWQSVDYIERGIDAHMAGSQFEELVNAIIGALRTAPGRRMSMSALVRKKGISKADQKLVKSALDRLWERGDINKPTVEGRGLVVSLQAG